MNALVATSPDPAKGPAARFLEGLAADELRYIAEFLGAGVVNPELRPAGDRRAVAERIQIYEARRTPRGADASHKMILLLEFLTLARRSRGRTWAAAPGRA